jgi:hypothetical protein
MFDILILLLHIQVHQLMLNDCISTLKYKFGQPCIHKVGSASRLLLKVLNMAHSISKNTTKLHLQMLNEQSQRIKK